MLQLVGRWLFRLWLMPPAALLAAWAVAASAVEGLLGWSREPLGTRLSDRLFGKGSVVFPALYVSFADMYAHSDDGPGWSDRQIPRLWDTCRGLANAMGCPPPDAIHLSLEPGDCFAWTSKAGGALRGHIALSLLDLRLMTQDEAHSVIAHEIAHAGFRHTVRRAEEEKQLMLMDGVIEQLPALLVLPVYLARAMSRLGAKLGAHDVEREADRKSAEVVGGNHASSALRRGYLQGPSLDRMFRLVLTRAQAGPRAPLRLAEAAAKLYESFDLPAARKRASEQSELEGERHPSLPARVEAAESSPGRLGVGGKKGFIEAYPELLVAEELLTKTYFPDTPVHARSDASQLKRKALAARLKRL